MPPWAFLFPGLSSSATAGGIGLLALLGGLFLWRVYRHQRRFGPFRRLRCSVVTLQQGTLRVRTLCEMPVRQLSCRRRTIDQLVAAAPHATLLQPFPRLDTDDVRELRAGIAACVSSLTPTGHLHHAQGAPTTLGEFIAGIVSDAEGPPHRRRLRLLVVPRSVLEHLPSETPQFEQRDDASFWSWLQFLSRTWQENPLALARVELAFVTDRV